MTLTQRDAYSLIHQGCIALSEVEANGIRIDMEYLQKAIDRTKRHIKHISDKLRDDEIFTLWRKVYGSKTNMGSRTQLANILFDQMGLECNHFTASGQRSASGDALEEIDLPFTRNIIRLEKLKKTANTYLKGIQEEVVDGFIHPFYNLHTTRTFRSSSSEPNFQNIPIRDPEMSKIIRRCFIPRKDCVLVESDYGRLEVCVAACYNRDPVLIEYINDKTKDMHRDMASEIFTVPQDDVSKDMRFAAKGEFVFAQFYGAFYGSCAEGLWRAVSTMKLATRSGTPVKDILLRRGISRLGDCEPKGDPVPGTFAHHIQKVANNFWRKRFRVYDAWKRAWWDSYEKNGQFTTLTGFVIKGHYARNDVTNYPIQGSGFHCLLWTLIMLSKELRKRKMKAKIVGQIHDSILADVPEEEIGEYVEITNKIATQDICKAWDWIIVPLEMEFEACPVGGSWHDKKLMEVWENEI